MFLYLPAKLRRSQSLLKLQRVHSHCRRLMVLEIEHEGCGMQRSGRGNQMHTTQHKPQNGLLRKCALSGGRATSSTSVGAVERVVRWDPLRGSAQ